MGVSILLVAAGAILAWAVNASTTGVDLHAVGLILLVVGLIGVVVSLIGLVTPSRESHAVIDHDDKSTPVGRERVVERERY